MRKNKKLIKIFEGETRKDSRGSVSFSNSFSFSGIKRFYQLQNSRDHPIRAFHIHMKEAKYFYVISGQILLCAVWVDDPKNPSKDVNVEKFILSAEEMKIVAIPAGYANGIKSLTLNAKVIVYSNATLAQSMADDYRVAYDYWGENIWEVD